MTGCSPHTNFAVIDNWRFWIIHLWVEGFFELFATVLVAIMFYQMGVVSTKTAARLIYLDAILYLSGGIIGTGHHWYFTGEGTLNMGLAACFSALEVVPLTLLTLDAWDFIKLRKAQCSEGGHDLVWGQKWSIYLLMAVGVWNFVGAGSSVSSSTCRSCPTSRWARRSLPITHLLHCLVSLGCWP